MKATSPLPQDLEGIAAGLPATPLEPGRSIQERLRARLDFCVRAMLAHDPGTRDGSDPEELHQMRVAVRRMRALLKTAQPFLDDGWSRPLRAELGWLGRCLGPVRDLDVLLQRLDEEASDLDSAERAGFALLTAALREERAQFRASLQSALDSDRYRDLVASLVRAVQRSATESPVDGQTALRHIAGGQFRKLRKKVRRTTAEAPDEELHSLRIDGKRLRYTSELASGRRARELVTACKRFQDILGEHQDACVAMDRIKRLLNELGTQADATAAFVAGRLVEREAARRAIYREQWRSRWKPLRKCAGKWGV